MKMIKSFFSNAHSSEKSTNKKIIKSQRKDQITSLSQGLDPVEQRLNGSKVIYIIFNHSWSLQSNYDMYISFMFLFTLFDCLD